MEAKEAYILMSKRFFDQTNDTMIIPDKLENYLNKLTSKKTSLNYKYINLKDFQGFLKSFLIEIYEDESKFTLKLENNSEIKFNLIKTEKFAYKITFEVKKKKSKDSCLTFEWYPFLNTIYLRSLFYNNNKEKIVANLDCKVSNIPDKSGEFFLNVIEDIAKSLGVKKILLYDASTIEYNSFKISLGLFYLQKHGTTYYGKFNFNPIKTKEYHGKIMNDIFFNIKFKSADDEMKYIKNKLKKLKPLTKDNFTDWLAEINQLEKYFPVYYIKNL